MLHIDPVEKYLKVLEHLNGQPVPVGKLRRKVAWDSPNKSFSIDICLGHLHSLGLIDREDRGFVLSPRGQEAMSSPTPHDILDRIRAQRHTDMRCHVCGSREEGLEWFQVKWWCREHLLQDDGPIYTPLGGSMLAMAPAMAPGWVKSYANKTHDE